MADVSGYKERPKRKKCEQEDRGPFHISLRRKRDPKRSLRASVTDNADRDNASEPIETSEGQQVEGDGSDLRSDRTAPPPSPKMVLVMISPGPALSEAGETLLSSPPPSTVLDLPSSNACPSEKQSQSQSQSHLCEDCRSKESKDSYVIEVPPEDSDMEDCFAMQQQPTETGGGLAAMDCDCDWNPHQNNVDDKDVEMAPISTVDFDASDSDPRKMSIDSINPEPSNIWNFSQPVPFNLPTVDEEMQDAGPIFSNQHPQSWVWDNKHCMQDPSIRVIEMQDATHITAAEARPDMQSIRLVISLTPPTPAAPTPAPSIQFLPPKLDNVAPTQRSSTAPAFNAVTSSAESRSQRKQDVVPPQLATPPSPKPPILLQTSAVAPRRQRANALLAPVTGDIDSKSKTLARRHHQRSASADFALGIGVAIRDTQATLPDYVSDDEQESSYASAGPGPSSSTKAKGKLKAEPFLPTPESSPPRNNMVSSSVTAEPEELVSTYDKQNADGDIHGLELDYDDAEEPKSKPPTRHRITSQEVDDFFASLLSPCPE